MKDHITIEGHDGSSVKRVENRIVGLRRFSSLGNRSVGLRCGAMIWCQLTNVQFG